MKQKPKRDGLAPQMRERLLANRSGKMTTDQWMDMVMQPLTALLVLMLPAVFFLPRLLLLLARGGWLLLLLLVLGVVATFLFRAYRYARAPIYFGEFAVGDETAPSWAFWKPLVLRDEQGNAVKFGKRLAPRPMIQRDVRYMVYYLREPGDQVLLSIAPIDHPDAESWQPDRLFDARFKHRGG